MINAVVKGRSVVTLDPLPEDWAEGDLLVIDRPDHAGKRDDLDLWDREMAALASQIPEEDFATIERVLAEADAQAKDMMRREMGL